MLFSLSSSESEVRKTNFNNIFVCCKFNPTNERDLWLFHGLCESNECFTDIFSSNLAKTCNIYALDLPGFGKSPLLADTFSVEAIAEQCSRLIQHFSGNRKIYLLGHSMGIIPVMLIAKRLENHVSEIINAEGTIVETPNRFSYRVNEYLGRPDEFKQDLISEFERSTVSNQNSWSVRYLKLIRATDARALMLFCQATKQHTAGNAIGEEYLALNIPTVFIYGANSHLRPEINFIKEHNSHSIEIPNCRHWMMLERPEIFYKELEGVINLFPLETNLTLRLAK